MTSPYMTAVVGAAAVLSGTFGKEWTLLPRVKGADRNAPVVADTSRPQVTFLARLHTPRAKALIPDAYDPRTDQRPGTSSNHPLLRIQPDQVALYGLVVAQDDIVLDVEANQRWRVSSARSTSTGTLECIVELV